MRSQRRRRFARVQQALAQVPFRAAVVNEAFDTFRWFGELPEDDDRLADALLQRALRGGDAKDPVQMSELERLVITVVPESYRPPEPTVRERLFDEALCDDPYFRKAGRVGIEILVCKGGDVCDPAFGADAGLPKYGSVGLHVLGYPQRLAVPPYEAQAHRLFAQLDDYRERVVDDSQAYFDRLTDATTELLWNGELPHDPFLREGAILQAEFSCLWEHKRGKDVAAAMAAFDAVARAEGKRREAAVRRLEEVLRAG